MMEVDPIIEGVETSVLKVELKIKTGEEDITDETVYSI